MKDPFAVPPEGDPSDPLEPLLNGLQPVGFRFPQQRIDLRQGVLASLTQVAVLDDEGTVVSVNGAWSTFSDVTPSPGFVMPGVGANFLDACREQAAHGNETAEEVLLGTGAILAGMQRLFTVEYACSAPGSGRWFLIEASPLDGPAGGIVVVHQDITERRMFEQTVAHFALRYWTVSEQASDYAYEILLEADGTPVVEWMTESFMRVTGYDMKELSTRGRWRDLLHPADLEVLRAHAERLVAGEPDAAEFRIVTRDGAIRWLRNHARPVWDGQAGRFVAIDGAAQDITEQKRAEEDLERNRQRLQALFDHTLDALLMADDSGCLVDANPAACTLFGYRRDELLGLYLPQVMQEPGAAQAQWKAFLAAGQQHGEFTLRRRDGASVEVEYRSVAHILDGLHLSVLRDVTERKHAIAGLRASEERFRALVQNASDYVSVLDADGVLLYTSPAVERIIGYRPEEIIGTHSIERVHPEDRPHLIRLFPQVLRGEVDTSVFRLRYRIRHADGRWVHVETTGTNLLDNPFVGGIVLNSRDVTDRIHAEEALRESEARWRLLVDNHPEPILVTVDARLVFVNRAGTLLAGDVPMDELLGRPLTDFVGADRIDDLERHMRAVGRGEAPPPLEYPLIRLDGEERLVEAVSVQVSYQGVAALQTVLRDVTERRRYEQGLIAAKEEAERVARLRSTILSNMSHEIRTPLTTVLGFAEVLAEEVEGPQRELVELIERGGKRLSHTLNSVLDLARLEAGSLLLHPEPLDVVAKVREVVALARPALDGKPLRLEVTACADTLRAHLDPGVLGRVVGNLVDNAIKFTDHGGVDVFVDATEERVVVRVRDTGIGIGPAFLPRLFEEFEQESSGLARSYEGSGLGLTITKRLVDLVGGTIEVESEKDRGSTFTVQLPRFMPLASSSAA